MVKMTINTVENGRILKKVVYRFFKKKEYVRV